MYIRQAEITENPNDLLVEMTEGLQSVATALVEVVYPVFQCLRSHLVHILRSSPGCNPGQEPPYLSGDKEGPEHPIQRPYSLKELNT